MVQINSELFELSRAQQDEIVEQFEHEMALSRRHCAHVHFTANHHQRPNSYRSIDDPRYEPPTLEEFNEVVQHLEAAHSLGVVSKMLGIYKSNDPNKTIKRWMNGESRIPYAAWRLLLILDGRVVQVNRLPEADGAKPWAKFYSQGE